MSGGLFSDLLVIDCASFVAGPAAATIMSDFGARVIKIEPPGRGDSYRDIIKARGDPALPDYFWALDSRNKESLTLDLKTAEARLVLEKLVRKADVFITNYPFPVRERLRLRAEDITPINQKLIYASLSPYGERGPERDWTAFDLTAWWARSGLMELVRPHSEAELSFSLPGMGDHPTAMSTFAAIAMALYRRSHTGAGGVVSTSLLANGLWANSCQVQAALYGLELAPAAPGSKSAFGEIYRTEDDRLFFLAIVNHLHGWSQLVQAVERPELLDDVRFSTPAARTKHVPELVAILRDAFAGQPWDYWKSKLSDAGLTFSVVAQTSDHMLDPQIEANGFLSEFVDGDGLKTVDSPIYIVGEHKSPPRMAPSVGQHTRQILEECGCSRAEVERLTRSA